MGKKCWEKSDEIAHGLVRRGDGRVRRVRHRTARLVINGVGVPGWYGKDLKFCLGMTVHLPGLDYCCVRM